MFANFSAFNWKKVRRNIFASSFYGFAYNLHVLELKDSKYVASVDDRKCMRLLTFWRPTEGGRKHASSLLANPPSQPASCPLSHMALRLQTRRASCKATLTMIEFQKRGTNLETHPVPPLPHHTVDLAAVQCTLFVQYWAELSEQNVWRAVGCGW